MKTRKHSLWKIVSFLNNHDEDGGFWLPNIHWNPSKRQYGFETFCYGPKSCSFYRPGPPRKVPWRKGMSCT